MVVANRVQAADGTWRSLDAATLFRFTVALSELHEGAVQDLLTARLGVTWRQRDRLHSPVPRWDIDGVPTELIDEFSSRSRDITTVKDALVEQFRAEHGRHPTNVELLKLRQRATLDTRPDKAHATLGELMQSWRARAAAVLRNDPALLPHRALSRADIPPLAADRMSDEMCSEIARTVLDTVATKRATGSKGEVSSSAPDAD